MFKDFKGLSLLVVYMASCIAVGGTDAQTVKRVFCGSTAPGVTLQPLNQGDARPYEAGFTLENGEYICDNGSDEKVRRGVSWSVKLEQTTAVPLLFSAKAMAESVSAAPGSADFSIYADVRYADGTSLYGQSAYFATTGDSTAWQTRELLIVPEKPVKLVACYLLFRSKSGRVRFKDMCFSELSDKQITVFDGLEFEQVLPPSQGFMVRDVAANSDFVGIREQALDVRMKTEVNNAGEVVFYSVKLEDLSGKDRAMTLVYTLPLPADAIFWQHDMRHEYEVQPGSRERLNLAYSHKNIGANGRLSWYPFGGVRSADNQGWAIGLDPATPVFYRIGCTSDTRELYLACDIGLAPEKPQADFRFCLYKFDGAYKFRGALMRYYQIYPAAFENRTTEHGIWMPFAKVSEVEGWEDFGFRFKEGTNETKWDDDNNLLTFRYTEPMTWWMRLEGEPFNYERGLAEAKRLATEGNNKWARAWETSAFEAEDGTRDGLVRKTPWCDGVVWSMNSAPGVPGELTDYSNKINPDYLEKTYKANSNEGCDGEYIDSVTGHVTALMNFRREHFAGMQRPLCFTRDTRKVGIYKGLICYEYIEAITREMRSRGKYMMGNGGASLWSWTPALLDVLGTETNWKRNGKWQPMSDENMMYRRAMCKNKPYCFLMNTDFTDFTREDTEKYMKRAVAYGMFPGFFSANASTGQYFKNPLLYNRDRPLFKKYIPLCKLLAKAGWEPLTGAATDKPGVYVERFGAFDADVYYLTLYNDSEETQKTTVSFAQAKLERICKELTKNTLITWQDQSAVVELPEGDVRVFAFQKE